MPAAPTTPFLVDELTSEHVEDFAEMLGIGSPADRSADAAKGNQESASLEPGILRHIGLVRKKAELSAATLGDPTEALDRIDDLGKVLQQEVVALVRTPTGMRRQFATIKRSSTQSVTRVAPTRNTP